MDDQAHLPAGAATSADDHAREMAVGQRFAFGANWTEFLKHLSEERITIAEQSLRDMLGVADLKGRTFLDIGSGSGLFSLAARRLGAQVTSFDYDPKSVACTGELRRRYFPDDAQWTVAQGSVLDAGYLATLGAFDVVYSWGVLHHTGAMWTAMDHAAERLAAEGTLFIALYNDQGAKSRAWWHIKRIYNALPWWLRWTITGPALVMLCGPRIAVDTLRLRPFEKWRTYAKNRGMSPWYDVVDWVGGFPFEVSKPEQILDWGRKRQLILERMITVGGKMGCNQYVLRTGTTRSA
jgi:2-polyprenyl-3-methyl-5-hydroxy-6-metoxy-1,4-benzoquinol methylase